MPKYYINKYPGDKLERDWETPYECKCGGTLLVKVAADDKKNAGQIFIGCSEFMYGDHKDDHTVKQLDEVSIEQIVQHNTGQKPMANGGPILDTAQTTLFPSPQVGMIPEKVFVHVEIGFSPAFEKVLTKLLEKE